MFETAAISSGPKTKRMWATGLGVAGQAVLVGGMFLAPLIWPRSMPDIMRSIPLAAPPAPQGRPKPVETRVQPRVQAATRSWHGFTQPVRVPDRVVAVIDDPAPAPTGPYIPGAVPGAEGSPGGSVFGAISLEAPQVVRPPDPPPPSKPPAPAKPVRITEVRMAEPIQRMNPTYPEMAKRTRISGKVELMGVLGTDGRIHEIKVLSGHPFLVKAAVDAVMQWVYRPTILNGQPVEVQAPITITFILN